MYSSAVPDGDPDADAVAATDAAAASQPRGDAATSRAAPGSSGLTLPSSSAGLSGWASTVARRMSTSVRGAGASPDRRNPSVVIATPRVLFARACPPDHGPHDPANGDPAIRPHVGLVHRLVTTVHRRRSDGHGTRTRAAPIWEDMAP